MRSRALFVATIFALMALVVPESSFAQRRGGSFGGGGRSFGGGTRSFGGGSSRPSGSFSAPRSSSSSGSSSFGRSGAFGGPKSMTSSQSRGGSPFSSKAPPVVSNPTNIQHNTYINYGGYGGPVHMYGGWSNYSYGWVHPAWYFYTPFHPAFYYSPPYYSNGYYEPGGFSFFKFILGLAVIGFIVWVVVKLFTLGRGNRYSPPPPPGQW